MRRLYRRTETAAMAVEGAKADRFSCRPGNEELRRHPLIVDVAAGLCQTLRRAQGGGEKKVIHVEQGTAQYRRRLPGQPAFAAAAAAIEGRQYRPVRLGQGGQLLQKLLQQPVGLLHVQTPLVMRSFFRRHYYSTFLSREQSAFRDVPPHAVIRRRLVADPRQRQVEGAPTAGPAGWDAAVWGAENSAGHVTQKVLTAQLRQIEASGLLTRAVYAQAPPRVEYTLTEPGYSLRPVLDAMQAWGDACQKAEGGRI